MRSLEKFFLQLSIFLIPSNLAIHWYIKEAYLNGRLIDYLLPKIYIFDLTILGLFIFYVFNISYINGYYRLFNASTSSRNNFKNIILNPLFIFATYLIIRASFSSLPLVSLFFTFKLIWIGLFGLYLYKRYTRENLVQQIACPLIISVLFQSLLSIFQFLTQKPLFGYYLLGETDITSMGISRINLFNGTYIAPYGTTPHPNVLTGFLVIASAFLLLQSYRLEAINKLQKALKIISISLSIPVIILTNSLSGIISGLIAATMILISKYVSRQSLRLIFLAVCVITPIVSMITLDQFYQYNVYTDNDSITVRYELNQAAFEIFKANPLFGVGPNLFTSYLPNITFSNQKTLVLQPVHNILLLLIAETGIVGLSLLIISVISLYKKHRLSAIKAIPLIMIIIIGSWDHYPLSLQTGQLLLALSLVLSLK